MFVRAAYFIGRPHAGREAALDRQLRDALPMYANMPGCRRVELQRSREAEHGAPAGLFAVLEQTYDDSAALQAALASPQRTRLRAHFTDAVLPLFDGSVAHVNHEADSRRFEAGDGSATEAAWLARLFTAARSHNDFRDEPVPDSFLVHLYELMKWGPTAANSGPARIQFVRSAEAKARLLPCLKPTNVTKVQAAPVTAVIGMEMNFPDTLPSLFLQEDARDWFAGNEEMIRETALRNGSLQGGYFILAARALGLDCAPMSGFHSEMVDRAFWAGTTIRTNFLCALGHGREEALAVRGPRLPFEAACRIV